ncbi:MAG: sigma-70 region 4 domain-containing protein, partial [Gemmataceae bacterium]|nr:sigma-70 region 4 domain-containing protein [Gemmataceae bacterium]
RGRPPHRRAGEGRSRPPAGPRGRRPRPDAPPDPLGEITARELLAVGDEEVSRLPPRYRGPLVLCYLEGLTRDEAARSCGWSPSTFARRLRRGRERLKARLPRRGVGLRVLRRSAG